MSKPILQSKQRIFVFLIVLNSQIHHRSFAETGECRYGFKCRFLRGHVRISDSGELSLMGDDDKKAHAALTAHEVNFVGADVQRQLPSRRYPLPISNAYLKQLAAENAEADGNDKPKPVPAANSFITAEPEKELDCAEMVPPQPKVKQVIEERDHPGGCA